MLLETQGSVSAMSYDNWLSNTEAVCIADDELVVSADSEVVLRLVEMKYADLLKACTKKVAPKNKKYKICAAFGKKQIRRRKVYFAGGIERGQHCCGGILHQFRAEVHLDSFIVEKATNLRRQQARRWQKIREKNTIRCFCTEEWDWEKLTLCTQSEIFSKKKSDPTIKVYVHVEREVYKRFDRGAARV